MAANSPFGATASAVATPAAVPAAQPAAAPAAAPAAQPAAAPGLGFTRGDPFSAPSGISGEKITQFEGELLLVKPTEVIPQMTTKRGVAENVIRAHVVVLSGPRMGEVINDMLVFQVALRRELTNVLNGNTPYLLGRLGKSNPKEGKDAAWIFTQFTEADYQVARNWCGEHPGW